MAVGYLVNPDLTARTINFELEQAQQFLGGAAEDRVSVAFQEDGSIYAALFNPAAAAEAAEPNPVASLARNTADTGNPAFLQDPFRAISGSVIFIGAEGGDISSEAIAAIDNSIRAVRAYREDNPEEYTLWRAAVLNAAR